MAAALAAFGGLAAQHCSAPPQPARTAASPAGSAASVTPPSSLAPSSSLALSATPAPASSSPPAVSASAAAGVGEPTTLAFDGGEATVFAPPSNKKRLTVFLHGMCASGKLECPVFAEAARDGFLLCPDGVLACQGGGFMWVALPKVAAERIDRAAKALAAKHGEGAAEGPRAIVGYSLGGTAAWTQVVHAPGRYDRLMLVNTAVDPPTAELRRAGVTRVALVAGVRDGTAQKLEGAARRLAKDGIDARFFSLAATGHYFDDTSRARLTEPLAWLLGP